MSREAGESELAVVDGPITAHGTLHQFPTPNQRQAFVPSIERHKRFVYDKRWKEIPDSGPERKNR